MILLDTNLLRRITDSADPQCADARNDIHGLLSKRERLIVVPQNLYEFRTVATRKPGPPPAGQNGLGMTVGQASQLSTQHPLPPTNNEEPV
jgi:predicted nucleic acid-binding protein